MIRYSLYVLLFFVWGCRNDAYEENGTYVIDWKKSTEHKNNFAEGFTIEQFKNYYRITVQDPQSGKEYGKFILYSKKDPKPKVGKNEIPIAYPVQYFASVSTTHLPFLKLLGEENSLCGFAGQKFVLSEHFIQHFEEKDIPELGSDNSLDIEKLIELSPDVLMVYPFGSLNFDKITAAKIPVFYNTEYLELHPLGKTEWIKVFGILYGKKEKADSLFNEISGRYHTTKMNIEEFFSYKNETVFTGLNFAGTWHVPGGKSFQARFLEDAGVRYVWRNDESNNSLSLPVETVIDKCIDADYWVIVTTVEPDFSLEDLINSDPNYKHFKAVKNKRVIFCNSGIQDYFGESIIEPDVILNDLATFFHAADKPYRTKYFHLLQ